MRPKIKKIRPSAEKWLEKIFGAFGAGRGIYRDLPPIIGPKWLFEAFYTQMEAENLKNGPEWPPFKSKIKIFGAFGAIKI